MKEICGVFFEALDYPEFARANFYFNKQKESNWRIGIFITALREVYHSSVVRLEIHYQARKNKEQGLKIEDIEIPIKDVTGGEESGNFNKTLLDELLEATEACKLFEKLPKKYSEIEILSFTEYSLAFILKQYKKLQEKGAQSPFTPLLNPLTNYQIVSLAPYFDFLAFKHAFRSLLLDKNVESLKIILKKYKIIAEEIVDLWNSQISYLEEEERQTQNPSYETVRVKFDENNLSYSWWQQNPIFDAYPSTVKRNYHFALFAVQIANLLSTELFQEKELSTIDNNLRIVTDIVKGIQKLTTSSDECIRLARNGTHHEHPFRDWFSNWLEAKDYVTTRESLIGNGHIDLHASHEQTGKQIIEFKGWWNNKKKFIIPQILSYLTQFEGEGYIIMINQTKNSITDLYKKIVTAEGMGYLPNSWKAIKFPKTSFYYYKSIHKLGPNIKTVYHFIISIH